MTLRRPFNAVAVLVAEVRSPGETDALAPGSKLWELGRIGVMSAILITNLIGAVAVVMIALFVVPLPFVGHTAHIELINAVLAASYVALAAPLGTFIGVRSMSNVRRWLRSGTQATEVEIRQVLQGPMRLFAVQVALWLLAAVLFALVNGAYSGQLGVRVFFIVASTGVVTASLAYLLTELALRPLAARALISGGLPRETLVLGVATRGVVGWILGTGVQLFGIVAIGVMALTRDSSLTTHHANPLHLLGVSMVVLGGTGLLVGLLAVIVVSRITADPIDSVRRALAEVERGHFDVRVPVYDGTQTGRLQLGFNQMVSGLEEREQLREAFGTYVDPDVAAAIMNDGVELSGEAVEVTCMFIDVRSFTSFAEQTPPDQVLAALNELFTQFVEVIHAHQGRVDKFIGDGLMAVFGAPRRLLDHADRALQAALEIAAAQSSAGLSFGIGLNSGTVVAGNVGGAGRLEFGVIGDAVNVAARVEAATRETGDAVLLSEHTRELLRGEQPELVERPGITLKGKTEPVRLYAPVI
jgi:adenylate cyclase